MTEKEIITNITEYKRQIIIVVHTRKLYSEVDAIFNTNYHKQNLNHFELNQIPIFNIGIRTNSSTTNNKIKQYCSN